MKTHTVPSPEQKWPRADLSLVGGQTTPAPAFPRPVLGDAWAEWCEATADAANAPYDYVATSLITTAASLIGNARVVAFEAWIEPSNVWSVLVGSPSAKKSPAMAPLKRIVSRLENELVAVHDPDDGRPPQLRIADVTAQAAGEVAAANAKAQLLQLDELSGWWSQINRTGGEQFWLEAFGGGSYTINRKGKAALQIARLNVSVLGTAQPDPLRDLLEAKTDRGFAARYLYVFPEPVTGFKRPKSVDQEVAVSALRRLRDLDLINGQPTVCPLTSEAADAAEEWLGGHIAETEKAHGAWEQWLGKQSGMLLRYALVIQHLWWSMTGDAADAPPTEVDVAAIRAAAQFISTYAKPMAARTFNMATRPQKERQAAFFARFLQRQELGEFNARDVYRGILGPVGTLSDPERLKEACEILVHASLIRKVGVRAGGTKGRAPATYEVNPALFDHS